MRYRVRPGTRIRIGGALLEGELELELEPGDPILRAARECLEPLDEPLGVAVLATYPKGFAEHMLNQQDAIRDAVQTSGPSVRKSKRKKRDDPEA